MHTKKAIVHFANIHNWKWSFSSNQFAHRGVQACCICMLLLVNKPQVSISQLLLSRRNQGLRLLIAMGFSYLCVSTKGMLKLWTCKNPSMLWKGILEKHSSLSLTQTIDCHFFYDLKVSFYLKGTSLIRLVREIWKENPSLTWQIPFS